MTAPDMKFMIFWLNFSQNKSLLIPFLQDEFHHEKEKYRAVDKSGEKVYTSHRGRPQNHWVHGKIGHDTTSITIHPYTKSSSTTWRLYWLPEKSLSCLLHQRTRRFGCICSFFRSQNSRSWPSNQSSLRAQKMGKFKGAKLSWLSHAWEPGILERTLEYYFFIPTNDDRLKMVWCGISSNLHCD